MIVRRGEVWIVRLPGIPGRKYSVVVSGQAVNRVLDAVLVARVTSVKRERLIRTWAPIEPGEVPALPALSFVICHDLFLVDKDPSVMVEQVGILSVASMLEVDDALRVALDLG